MGTKYNNDNAMGTVLKKFELFNHQFKIYLQPDANKNE